MIKLKFSETTPVPSELQPGELAISYIGDNLRFFIGLKEGYSPFEFLEYKNIPALKKIVSIKEPSKKPKINDSKYDAKQ